MQAIEAADIIRRIHLENPWWESGTITKTHGEYTPRAYFELFFPLIKNLSVRRAIVLMGPRRVGKTVMIHHGIQALIKTGVPPKSICYFSVDHPIYNGLSLEQLLDHYQKSSGIDYNSEQIYVFFDEIQYLRKWEEHLKVLVDTHANIKSIASGSAAAALRLKSNESGAGRLTDFLLPPLTFHEYLNLLNKTDLLQAPSKRGKDSGFFLAKDIAKLNEQFMAYLNFGGYPEVIFPRPLGPIRLALSKATLSTKCF